MNQQHAEEDRAEAIALRAEHAEVRVSVLDAQGLVPTRTLRAWAARRLPLLLASGSYEASVGLVLSELEHEPAEDLAWLVQVCKRAVRRAQRERAHRQG